MISALELALTLLQGILSAAKVKGLAPEVIADIAAAVQKLESVRGTDVTFQQLESLRVQPKW